MLGFYLEDMFFFVVGDLFLIMIYELNMEVEGEDKEMKDFENLINMVFCFCKFFYVIEIGEVEMIGM